MRGTFLSTAFLLASAATALAQMPPEVEAEAVKVRLSGQRVLVTWRDGGTLYGTYHMIDVAFCASGAYFSQGGTSKTTVLGNEQRSSFSDQGKWSVATLGQAVVLTSRSISGQVNAFPMHVLPDGSLWAGNGVTVVSRGPAPCR